jgi:hypothetical protein
VQALLSSFFFFIRVRETHRHNHNHTLTEGTARSGGVKKKKGGGEPTNLRVFRTLNHLLKVRAALPQRERVRSHKRDGEEKSDDVHEVAESALDREVQDSVALRRVEECSVPGRTKWKRVEESGQKRVN